MSEDKKDETKDEVNDDKVEDAKEDEKDEKPTKTRSLIDQNVALLMAENDRKDDHILDLTEKLNEMTTRLTQAEEMLAQKNKAKLLFDISPKTQVPKELLALKSLEELEKMKKVLDYARIPAFKSGTPIVSTNKSPEAKLYSMFDDWYEEHKKR